MRLKSVSFKWILHFFTFLSPPYFLEITNMVHEKNLKKHRYPKCIFSMHFRMHVKNFDTFLWNLGLYPKCPWHALNVTLLTFQPSNYAGKLAYILLYPKTKLFMRQVRILISRFFMSQYPLLFVDSIFKKRNKGGNGTIMIWCDRPNIERPAVIHIAWFLKC